MTGYVIFSPNRPPPLIESLSNKASETAMLHQEALDFQILLVLLFSSACTFDARCEARKVTERYGNATQPPPP